MGTFSIWHWLIVLLVVVLVFGSKKLGDIGKNVAEGIRGYQDGMAKGKEGGDKAPDTPAVTASEKTDSAAATVEKTAAS